MSDDNESLLIKIITDFQTDVRARFEALEAKYEKYVLESEFHTYKEYNKAWIENHWKSQDQRFTELDSKAARIGKVPSWIIAVIIGIVINLAAFGIEKEFIVSHTVPISSITTTQQDTSSTTQYHNSK